jgi:hypothetical protein
VRATFPSPGRMFRSCPSSTATIRFHDSGNERSERRVGIFYPEAIAIGCCHFPAGQAWWRGLCSTSRPVGNERPSCCFARAKRPLGFVPKGTERCGERSRHAAHPRHPARPLHAARPRHADGPVCSDFFALRRSPTALTVCRAAASLV